MGAAGGVRPGRLLGWRRRGAPLSLLTALGLAPLNVGQLVAGRSELAGRWVHWVNVLHWPASDAVRRGDLVLTTAVAPDRRDARQFLCEVIASPAAALVISMPSDVRLTGMLPEIVELAVERNFPVVLLPWEVPFADVTRALLTRLLTPAGARVGRSEAGLGKGAAVREPPSNRLLERAGGPGRGVGGRASLLDAGRPWRGGRALARQLPPLAPGTRAGGARLPTGTSGGGLGATQ